MTQSNSASPSRQDVAALLFELFRRDGVEGVSLSDISRATGLAKSSLYHHFPGGKTDMVSAVLDLAVTRIRDVVAPLLQTGSRAARIDAMLAGFAELSGDGFKPCILASMLIGTHHDTGRELIRTAVAQWIDALAFALADTGIEPAEARRRATVAVMQIEGAFLVTRALDERRPFEQAVAAVRAMLLQPDDAGSHGNGTGGKDG